MTPRAAFVEFDRGFAVGGHWYTDSLSMVDINPPSHPFSYSWYLFRLATPLPLSGFFPGISLIRSLLSTTFSQPRGFSQHRTLIRDSRGPIQHTLLPFCLFDKTSIRLLIKFQISETAAPILDTFSHPLPATEWGSNTAP